MKRLQGILFTLCLQVISQKVSEPPGIPEDINLPAAHLPYYFNLFPDVAQRCFSNSSCPYQNIRRESQCWGYEENCSPEKSWARPVCPGDHRGWARSKDEQHAIFYAQADFGYVATHRQNLQIVCEPTFREDSALECSDHLQFCRGRQLLLNLTKLSALGTWRYKMDVLQPGDLKGHCHFHPDRVENRSDHMSPLQSWAPELRNYQEMPQQVDPLTDCDIYFDRPVIIMKIDAAVNMYHHFCDFFNLYASLHVNASHPQAFGKDVEIIIWETFPYRSAFREVWEMFTHHEVRTLDAFAGKTVCFRNLMLPLLPRMIFGLFYNTPLIYGCERSGLLKAFSETLLHRLKIPEPSNAPVLNVTWLSRETSHRNVVNEKELINALAKEPGVSVQRVVFDSSVSFKRQLAIIRSTDIFIGMHGAGLTHLMFLPDWAAVFELYNCEDENCYLDLARLRGVKYVTWQNMDKLQSHSTSIYHDADHAKFVDYSFDVEEFLRLFRQLTSHVRSQKESHILRDEL